MIKWEDRYSIGNYLIDEQHKKLFELANMADNMADKQTDPSEIKKIIAALFGYMKTHFRDEEAYMTTIRYPYIEDHKERHKNIIVEMTSLVKDIKKDFKKQLVIIMEQWLLGHILEHDTRYHQYAEKMKEEMRNKSSRQKDGVTQSNNDEDMIKKSAIKTDVKNKGGNMYIYSCLCGTIYNIPNNVHQKIQSGEATHKCPSCTTNIKYITEHKV
ncbi:bacteriohemerythrin [Helicobacter muridarum]|uniref:Bacteriohemerythrin n=1 Tax=Helicobacter muridarum TaxID=216 RepID=A0A099TZ36_9HELI|nr:hemerythrin family protein [Helicobacter muridarum]TLD99626.1 bacteriohemerythrin [Helicobacter muridarum]STQ86761.1 hemerythrin family non-heme iron protein [Helicobacter muridarum]